MKTKLSELELEGVLRRRAIGSESVLRGSGSCEGGARQQGSGYMESFERTRLSYVGWKREREEREERGKRGKREGVGVDISE